jgi:hypothetical protein
LLGGLLEDELRDVLHGGVAGANEDGLSKLLQRFHKRIVMAQQHSVIELFVDPALYNPLDVTEIAHHVARVELPGADFDFRYRVMAVRMLAHTVVVEQPMAVAEIYAFGD